MDAADSSAINRAVRYRELAAELRSRASELVEADLRAQLHEIADEYEVLARHAENAPGSARRFS